MEKAQSDQNVKFAEALKLEEVPDHSQSKSLQGVVSEEEDPRLRRIKWKVDLRLSVILALMYIVNQIDRTNLPNA
jgi:hypothetical protein